MLYYICCIMIYYILNKIIFCNFRKFHSGFTHLTSCRGASSDFQYPNVFLSNFRKSYALFDFCGYQACIWYINMHTGHKLIHMDFLNQKDFKRPQKMQFSFCNLSLPEIIIISYLLVYFSIIYSFGIFWSSSMHIYLLDLFNFVSLETLMVPYFWLFLVLNNIWLKEKQNIQQDIGDSQKDELNHINKINHMIFLSFYKSWYGSGFNGWFWYNTERKICF